jgi:hypothetical protein
MEDVLGGDTEEFTPSYNELKRFVLKVLLLLNYVRRCFHLNLCISMWIYAPKLGKTTHRKRYNFKSENDKSEY